MLLHVVAKARFDARPLQSPETAWQLWRGLRRAFPDARAACLMPNHVHLIVAGNPVGVRTSLGSVLSGCSRSRKASGAAGAWEPIPDPTPVPDQKHLLRHIRYVHLNPCRDRLVVDPLCWPYSTHRAILGAHFDPWLDAHTLARVLSMSTVGFAEWFHAYVSGDPSVTVAGTPAPRPAPGSVVPTVPLGDVIAAVLSAAPTASLSVQRHRVVLLGHQQGWNDSALLARALGVTPQWIRRLRERPNAPLLRAATLCLGDPRCRWGAPDWRLPYAA